MSKFRFFFVGVVLLHLLSFLFDSDVGSYRLAVAPLAIGALAAAGGAALSDIANQTNRSNAEFQAKLQRDLMDYQWANYSSPKAVARSLSEIGLNPSVAFGQGSSVHTSTPNATAPAISPYDIGSSGSDLANMVLALSQAKKAGAEGVAQDMENKITEATFNEKIRSIGLQNKWTEEQTAKITQEIGLMSGQFNEIQQKIENMKSEKKLTDKNIAWYDRHMSAEINYIKSSTDYQNALKGLTDSQKQLLDVTMDDLKSITNLNKQQLEKIVGLLDKYGDAQAIVGMLSQVVGSASDLIGSITSFKNANKVIETITGSTTQKSNGDWSTTNTRTVRK